MMENPLVSTLRCMNRIFLGFLVVISLPFIQTGSTQENTPSYLLVQDSDYVYEITLYPSGEWESIVTDDWTSKPPNQEKNVEAEAYWTVQILEQSNPVAGPRGFVRVPGQETVIFVMTGENDPFSDFFLLYEDGTLRQLTRVSSLLNTDQPLLSASVSFISWRPRYGGQFLYRVRLRDQAGNAVNQLWIYDLDTGTEMRAPYFGQDPVWSPDGESLAGVRLNSETTPEPLYEIWVTSLLAGDEQKLGFGCAPQWSPDGRWIAYRGHNRSQEQGYTNCIYNQTDIFAVYLPTGISIQLSTTPDNPLTLIGWQETP